MLLHPRLGEEENAVAEGGDRLAVAVEEVEDEPLLAADAARVHSGLSPAPLIRAHPSTSPGLGQRIVRALCLACRRPGPARGRIRVTFFSKSFNSMMNKRVTE